MEKYKSGPLALTVHPVYGAIYQDGEFVQRGAVLGLSVDARDVVIAPISGWVRVLESSDAAPGLSVEIWQRPTDHPGPASDQENAE